MAKRATAVATRAAKPVANDTPESYYGMVVVTNDNQEDTVRMGVVISQTLADKGIKANYSVMWIKHKAGVETIDARWIGAKWVPNG